VDKDGGSTDLQELAPRIDVLVLANVLYYLGGPSSLSNALRPIRALLSDESLLIKLHDAADAGVLHRRAARMLDVPLTTSPTRRS